MNITDNYIPQKGDIIWLNFSPQMGKEQRGRRPALVISSYLYNKIAKSSLKYLDEVQSLISAVLLQ